VNGAFSNEKYTALQSCHVVNSTLAESGVRDCDFYGNDMDNNFECCDCHHYFGRPADDFSDDDCECKDSCVHAGHVADPDADIDRRIEESVEKALSDILSNMVHRCISDSLKNCIQI
jgi:hypothetical protein